MVTIDDIIYDAVQSDEPTELGSLGIVEPTLVGPNGTEVTPVFTETLRGTTQNDNVVHKTLCGDTTVEPVGEDEWRVTMEGLVLKEQLQELFEMRPAGNEIDVVTEARTHRDVNFDRFTYEQNDELNKGNFSYNGRNVTQPLFRFQLQTQDDNANIP